MSGITLLKVAFFDTFKRWMFVSGRFPLKCTRIQQIILQWMRLDEMFFQLTARVVLVCAAVLAVPMSAQSESIPVADTELVKNACVIILHGMGRTAGSMEKIAERVNAQGYTVWNESYSSLQEPIAILSQRTISTAVNFCRGQKPAPFKIHFVTHSLGGILLRQYLQTQTIEELDKIVMLSPPNHGSEIVDVYGNNWIFRGVMGPAFLQLGTQGLVTQLKPIPGIIGVITGDKSSDPWFSDTIPGLDDGKVSVASAKLAEMSDFMVLPVGHTFIMNDETVVAQILHFLSEGQFDHEEKSDQSGQAVSSLHPQ